MGEIYSVCFQAWNSKVIRKTSVLLFAVLLFIDHKILIAQTNETTISIISGSNPACQGDALTFKAENSCASSGVTYQWMIDGVSVPGEASATFSTSTLSNGSIITCECSFNDTVCGSSPTISAGITITINDIPTLTSTLTPSGICSGSVFNYTPAANVSGTTFTWSRASLPGISEPASSGIGNISEVITNTTNSAIAVEYIITSTANGCTNNGESVIVQIYPRPMLTSTLSPASICSGSSFSYIPESNVGGTNFTWTRAAKSGISEPSSSGNTDINEILTNTTSSGIIVDYIVTATANTCTNSGQTVSVTVKPLPLITSTSAPGAICSGSAFSYTPSSNISGASFSWNRPFVTGISEAASGGTGSVSETLTNTTSAAISVGYQFTATAAGCTGPAQNATVSVKPLPVLTSTKNPAAVCSGTTFSYSPSSSVVSTTYTWTRVAVPGISQGAASGSGSVNESLTNTTALPVQVTYSYSLTAAGCSNPGQQVIVSVNPRPSLSSTLTPAAICSGSVFNYSPESQTPGSTFSWTRAAVSGISQPAASGNGNVSEVLTNTTTSSKTVIYVFTTSANGCSGTSQNVSVSVKPLPSLTSTLTPPAICSGSTFSYTSASNISGSTFSWTRASVNGISNPAGSGAGNISEVLTNTTASNITVVYDYITTVNGCSNAGQNVTLTVKPKPVLSSTLTPTGVCSGSASTYTATSATAGTSFSWSKPAVANITPGATTGTGNVNMVLTNSIQSPVNVTYTYTLTAAGCTGPAQNVVVPVYPKPAVSNFSVVAPDVCAGSGSTVTINSTSLADGDYTVTYNLTDQNIATGNTATTTFSGNSSTFTTSVLTNTANNGSTTITVTAITNAYGCSSTLSNKSDNFNVDDMPTITSPDTTWICSGTTVGKLITTDYSNSKISFYADSHPLVNGESTTLQVPPNKKIDDILINTTLADQVVVYHVTPTSTNQACNGPTKTMYVVVRPAPTMTSISTATICSGGTFSIPLSADMGSTFEWKATDNPNTTGESLTIQTSNPLSNTINNIVTSTQVVNYQVNAIANVNGCKGPAQTVSVTVYPKPVLSSVTTTSRCNNISATYTASSATSGTTYSWSRPFTTGISNAASSGAGNVITETLNNTSNAPVNTTYSITLTANGCSNTQTVSVTVNPTPTLTAVVQQATVCEGTRATINLSGLLPGITSSITYTINGGPTQTVAGLSATAGGNASFQTANLTAANNGQQLLITSITTTGTTPSCAQTFSTGTTLSVTPLAYLSSTLTPPAICSGSLFSYTPASSTSGVSYSWTRPAVAGISNSTGSGSGIISESLTNTTNATVSVVYIITTINNGCSNTPQNVTVGVKPTPVLSAVSDIHTCSGSLIPAITFASSVTGTTFSWTNNNTSIGLPASGTGNIASFTATGNIATTATIVVAPVASGCNGAADAFDIVIRKAGSWIGVVSTDWFDPSNWDCGIVPNSTIDAIIPSTAPFMPNVDGSGAECHDLDVNSGATFCTATTNNIDIYGNWINNGACTHNTGTVTFKGNCTVLGGSNNNFHHVSIQGTLRAPSGNMNVSGNWTNNGTFLHNNGTVTLNGASMQLIGGTQSSTFNNLTLNSTGVTLNRAVNVEGMFTLTSGQMITTLTNILTLTNTATTTIGNAASFVQGPMKYIVATNAGNTVRNLPIGKDADWRPAVLTVSHSNATPVTYTAEVINRSADSLNYTLPVTVNWVSNVRWWQIDRENISNFITAKVQLYYGPNDGVTDCTYLTAVKTNGTGTEWFDIGGSGTANGTGSITSDYFSTFSKFTLGNRLGGPNPLPVSLTDFTAKKYKDMVRLSWITSSELNNDYFTIERSQDGRSFSEVVKVKGKGTTNNLQQYETIDEQPYKGLSYYRLKQTDFDGSYEYSDLRSVYFNFDGEVVIYPNPATPDGFYIQLGEESNIEILSVDLYDAAGKSVTACKTMIVSPGLYNVIPESGQLAKGLYCIQLKSPAGIIRSRLMVK